MSTQHFTHIILALALCFSCTTTLAKDKKTTVLITGANRGLGLELARQYRDKNYHVIATARNPKKASELNALGVQVEQLDVTNQSSIIDLKKKLKNQPIDILINNAGVLVRDQRIEDVDLDDLTNTIAVNTIGPFRVTQALLPNLYSGKSKTIINITSQLGSITNNNSTGLISYRASKAGLNQISRSMSNELHPQGFIVAMIHPGWVRTDMGGASATYSPRESVTKVIKVIDNLKPNDSSKFFDLNGQELPW